MDQDSLIERVEGETVIYPLRTYDRWREFVQGEPELALSGSEDILLLGSLGSGILDDSYLRAIALELEDTSPDDIREWTQNHPDAVSFLDDGVKTLERKIKRAVTVLRNDEHARMGLRLLLTLIEQPPDSSG